MAAGDPSATHLAEYLDAIGKSKLITQAQLAQVQARLQAGGEPVSAESLGQALIADELITPWQHEQLSAGLHDGFFIGQYRLLDYLSASGNIGVITAQHVSNGQCVALKILRPTLTQNEEYLKHFYDEVESVREVKHRNLVRVLDAGAGSFPGYEKLHYVVVEHVKGKTLQTIVETGGPLTPAVAINYLWQVCTALALAHGKGLAHKHLKPTNLILAEGGRVKVANLGIAQFLTEEDAFLSGLGPATNMAFQSPEQIRGEQVGPASDLYSLGCILYFLLTGSPPFTATNETDLMMQQTHGQPRPLSELRSDVSPELNDLGLRLLAKAPAERFADARDVTDLLAQMSLNAQIELSEDAPVDSEPVAEQPMTIVGDLMSALDFAAPDKCDTSVLKFMDAFGTDDAQDEAEVEPAEIQHGEADWEAPVVLDVSATAAPPAAPAPPPNLVHPSGDNTKTPGLVDPTRNPPAARIPQPNPIPPASGNTITPGFAASDTAAPAKPAPPPKQVPAAKDDMKAPGAGGPSRSVPSPAPQPKEVPPARDNKATPGHIDTSSSAPQQDQPAPRQDVLQDEDDWEVPE